MTTNTINREIDSVLLHPLQADGGWKFPPSDAVPDWFRQDKDLDIVRCQVVFPLKGTPTFAVDVWGVPYSKFLAVTPHVTGPELTFKYEFAGVTHIPTGKRLGEGPPAEMHSLANVYFRYIDPDDMETASSSDKNHPSNLRLKAVYRAWQEEVKSKVDAEYARIASYGEDGGTSPSVTNFILRTLYEKYDDKYLEHIKFHERINKIRVELESEYMGNARQLSANFRIGGVYRHYKGNEYEVLHVARHTSPEAQGQEFVIYRENSGQRNARVWIRPFIEFLENVNGVPRFTYLRDSDQPSATLDINPETVRGIKDKLKALHGLINGTDTPFSPVLVQEIDLLDKLLAATGESPE